MVTLMEMLFAIFDLVFDFWFVLMFAPLQNKRNSLVHFVLVWGVCAIMRLVLAFNPEPVTSLIIPEPLNTILFFVVGLCLIAAWLIWRSYKSGALRKKALGLSVNDLLELNPSEFEEMAAELYRAHGYQARRTRASGDHGVDVVVMKDGKKMIVQCKRWRKPVGEAIIREFYGALHHEKAVHGTIIATSGFTKQAVEWAKGKPLSLHDGDKFIKLWHKVKVK